MSRKKSHSLKKESRPSKMVWHCITNWIPAIARKVQYLFPLCKPPCKLRKYCSGLYLFQSWTSLSELIMLTGFLYFEGGDYFAGWLAKQSLSDEKVFLHFTDYAKFYFL